MMIGIYGATRGIFLICASRRPEAHLNQIRSNTCITLRLRRVFKRCDHFLSWKRAWGADLGDSLWVQKFRMACSHTNQARADGARCAGERAGQIPDGCRQSAGCGLYPWQHDGQLSLTEDGIWTQSNFNFATFGHQAPQFGGQHPQPFVSG
jgi:hypothetical protein